MINGKLILIGSQTKLYFIDKLKIVDGQKERRKNIILALDFVQFTKRQEFLEYTDDYILTLGDNESYFTAYDKQYIESGRIKCIRGVFLNSYMYWIYLFFKKLVKKTWEQKWLGNPYNMGHIGIPFQRFI